MILQVVVMTVPTAIYKPEFAGYIPLWRERNEVPLVAKFNANGVDLNAVPVSKYVTG